MTKTEPLPDLALDPAAEPPSTDDLPILLTEGEPIGESVFAHSTLQDPEHPTTHRATGDLHPTATTPQLAQTAFPAVWTPAEGTPAFLQPRAPKASLAVHVHKARLQDARDIFDLVNSLSHDGTLLRRSYAEICENIRDFTVAEIPPTPEQLTQDPSAEPEFLGCGALHLYGPHLAEVRSIVLYPHARNKGAGAALLQALLAESEEHGVATTCLFTRLPTFFERFGFRTAERNAMPDKIYKDCQACPRLYACDEVAMVKGPLPNMAVLGPIHVKQPKLVQVQPANAAQLIPTGTTR